MARNYRLKYWNYKGRGIYMITMNIEGRVPLLGTLQGGVDGAWVEYSPVGKMVSELIEVAVRGDFAKGSLSAVGFGMLLTGEKAEEVFGSVVERVLDKMVNDTDIRFAILGTNVSRPLSIESERHEDVAVFIAEMAHVRVYYSPFAIMTQSARCS